MRIFKNIAATVLATLVLAVTPGAFAAHGKAGLWSVEMSIAGQDTSKMPADVIKQMKERGMVPNASGGFTLTRCMTAAEVADDSKMIDVNANKDCQITNRNNMGHAVSADLVCKGEINGTGHVSVDYDSDRHYTGQMLMTAVASDGSAIRQDEKFEGRWVSGDCTASH